MNDAPPELSARDRLVATADRLFYAEGIRAVGIDRVIAEAGVAKMTLYHHFKSKDDLIVAVLTHRERAVDAFFAAQIARREKAAGGRLAAFFGALKAWFKTDGFRGCAFQNANAELADASHPGTAFVRGTKRRFHAFVADLVREAVGPSGAAAAPAVCLLVEGAIVTAAIDGKPDAADAARDAALRILGGVQG